MKSLDELIMDYLCAHPHASDTLEGIAQWWIPSLLNSISPAEIEKALRRLVEDGLVDTSAGVGGSVFYRLGKRNGSGD